MGGPGAMKSRLHKVIYLWIIPSGSTTSYVYHTLSIQSLFCAHGHHAYYDSVLQIFRDLVKGSMSQ